jgi:2-polyprenyl-6-methoxyphenol hydroxylase-like FAD-dependent oxidoreductase
MSRPLDIAILGAGIGGLAAATLLKRAGHTVNVYEQAPRFARVGAGIQMAPNAMKVLRALGIEERIRQVGFQSEVALSREWDTGEITSELKLGREVEARYGAPYLFLHRADLHAAIESAVASRPVHLDMKLVGLDESPRGALLERDPLPRWHTAKVLLLGDACHPMTPYMAQGAASALEDAAVLARVLAKCEPDATYDAFAIYEATRKPRATAIQTGSSQNTWLRDKTDPGWVYGYDALHEPLARPPAHAANL